MAAEQDVRSAELGQRHEWRFGVAPERLRFVERAIEGTLRASPLGEQRVELVFLDRPDLAFARQALESAAASVEVRVKSYGAPDPCWVEVKREEGGAVHKGRFRLARRRLGALLAGSDLAAEVIAHNGNRGEALSAYHRLRALLADGPLVPVAAASFLRRAYEAGDRLRASVDRAVRYHAPPPSCDAPFPSSESGTSQVRVELKTADAELPAPIARALRNLGVPLASTFVSGIGALFHRGERATPYPAASETYSERIV